MRVAWMIAAESFSIYGWHSCHTRSIDRHSWPALSLAVSPNLASCRNVESIRPRITPSYKPGAGRANTPICWPNPFGDASLRSWTSLHCLRAMKTYLRNRSSKPGRSSGIECLQMSGEAYHAARPSHHGRLNSIPSWIGSSSRSMKSQTSSISTCPSKNRTGTWWSFSYAARS